MLTIQHQTDGFIQLRGGQLIIGLPTGEVISSDAQELEEDPPLKYRLWFVHKQHRWIVRVREGSESDWRAIT